MFVFKSAHFPPEFTGVGYLQCMESRAVPTAEDGSLPMRSCGPASQPSCDLLAAFALVSLILVTDFLDTPGAKPEDMKVYMDVLDVKNNGFISIVCCQKIHPHLDPFGMSGFESLQNLSVFHR